MWNFAIDAKEQAFRSRVGTPAQRASAGVDGGGAVTTPKVDAMLVSDGSFWDQAKYDAALKAESRSGDEQSANLTNDGWMKALNPLSGLTKFQDADPGHEFVTRGGTDFQEHTDPTGAVYKDKLGRTYRETGKDANGNALVQFFDNSGEGWVPPGSDGKVRLQPTYSMDASGNATPVSSGTAYKASEWVRNGQPLLTGAAVMVAAYFGGSWLAAYQAGAVPAATAAAEGGVSAAQLSASAPAAEAAAAAAPIAQTSATQAALYGNAAYGASTAAEAGFAGLGATTAGGSAGLSAAEIASLNAGTGTAGAGAAAAAGAPATAAPGAGAGVGGAASAAAAAGKGLIPGLTNAELAKLGIGVAGSIVASGKANDAAAGASDAAAKNAADLAAQATDQLSFNKAVYADGAAARKAALDTSLAASKSQLAAQDQQTAIAGEYKEYNKGTFRPLEKSIVADAEAFDTPEKRQAAAEASMADVNAGFSGTNAARARQLAANGIDPSSTRSMSAMAGQDVSQAEALASAAYKARKGVETTGFARKMDAASLGRNLPSAQSTAAATGINAGSAASSSAGAGVQAQQAGVPNMNAGYSGSASTLNNAAGVNYNVGRLQQTADQYNSQLWGQLGNFAGSVISDENMKTDITDATDEEALDATNATPVKNWRYDAAKMAAQGLPMDDGAQHTGPMAQDVNEEMGETAAPGGKQLDLITMNGVNMKAVQAVDKKVEKLTKTVSSLAAMIRSGSVQAGART